MTIESTYEARIDGRSQDRRRALVTAGAYWFLVLGALTFFRRPFNGVMSRIVDLRSEYGVVEQASRFFLLLGLAVIALTYYRPTQSTPRYGPPLFGLMAAMLIAESDFTSEEIIGRPLFIAILGLWALFELFRAGRFGSLLLLGTSMGVLATSAVMDYLEEHPGSGGIARDLVEAVRLDELSEEHFDLVGIAGVAFVALMLFRGSAAIRGITADQSGRLYVGLAALGLLAIGNSLLHWRYEPSLGLRLGGSLLTIIALAALAWAGADWLSRIRHQSPMAVALLGLGLVTYFIVVPNVYWGVGLVVTLGVWFPVVILGTALWYRASPQQVLSPEES